MHAHAFWITFFEFKIWICTVLWIVWNCVVQIIQEESRAPPQQFLSQPDRTETRFQKGLSGLSPHCWNTDCHPLSEQWHFFNNFILISLGQSPDTLVIQEVISPRSCHSGSSRGCWPGPSLSLPKPSPAGVLRTEQFCASSNGFASVLHFCVFPMLFGFFYFIFLISGMVLHLLLLPFFSKCFSACWSFFLLLPHFPCWSHLFFQGLQVWWFETS